MSPSFSFFSCRRRWLRSLSFSFANACWVGSFAILALLFWSKTVFISRLVLVWFGEAIVAIVDTVAGGVATPGFSLFLRVAQTSEDFNSKREMDPQVIRRRAASHPAIHTSLCEVVLIPPKYELQSELRNQDYQSVGIWAYYFASTLLVSRALCEQFQIKFSCCIQIKHSA